MGMRDSLSRLKKKVKHLGSKRKLHRPGADVDEESVDSGNSLQRTDPHHVIAGDGEGDGADADGGQACSADQPPLPGEPEPAPASGSEDDQGGEAGVDGREVGQVNPHQHPDVEVVVGSGPAREGDNTDEEEGEQFYSCSSTPSTPRGGEPNGM